MNINSIENFADSILKENRQFMEEYNKKIINLNLILDEGNITDDIKKLGEDVFLFSIEFYKNKLDLWREKLNNDEIIQLIQHYPELNSGLKKIENILFSGLDKSVSDLLSFIRIHVNNQTKVERNKIIQKSLEIVNRLTTQLNIHTDSINNHSVLVNELTKKISNQDYSIVDIRYSEELMNKLKEIHKFHTKSVEEKLEEYKDQVALYAFTNKFTEEEKEHFLKLQNIIYTNLIQSYKELL